MDKKAGPASPFCAGALPQPGTVPLIVTVPEGKHRLGTKKRGVRIPGLRISSGIDTSGIISDTVFFCTYMTLVQRSHRVFFYGSSLFHGGKTGY
jgi:hypothetical protein